MKKKFRILSIIVFGLFIIGLFSFNTSSVDETQKDAIFEKQINLKDGQLFVLPEVTNYQHNNRLFSVTPEWHLDFENRFPLIPKPLLIKTLEKHPSDYYLLEDYILENINDRNLFNFPKNFNPNGIIGEGHFLFYGVDIPTRLNPSPFKEMISNNPDDFRANQMRLDISFGTCDNSFRDFPIAFFRKIIQTKTGREMFFKILKQYYDLISHDIPLSSKKRLVSKCDELINFSRNKINNFPIKIAKDADACKYQLPEKCEFINSRHGDEMEYLEGFILRRNKVDKVPVSEIIEYLTLIRQKILSSYDNSTYRNYFQVKVNNLWLVQDLSDGYNEITSINSKKSLKLKLYDKNGEYIRYSIKLIIDNSNQYFKLEKLIWSSNQPELIGLYDKDLNKVL